MAASYAELNLRPYEAPLDFEEPPYKWVRAQTKKGNNNKTVTIPDADFTGQWVIVTGGNNGIGREAALQFARWGANLVLACRTPPPHETHPDAVVQECQQEAQKAGHMKSVAEWWEIDMADLASVQMFAKRWNDTGRPIDRLCNNAGMGGSPGGIEVFRTKDGFEIVHQVNLLSHVLLTLSLLPSIAKAKEPRIVCTTSCFHYPGKWNVADFQTEIPGKSGMGGVQFYMNNKLYYQTWLSELQRRLLQHDQYKHITINGVHPGYVNSGIWTFAGEKTWANWIKQGVLQWMAYFMAINPQQGSLCITNAASALEAGPDPKVQGVGKEGGKGGGRYFSRIWEEEPMPHTKDRDCMLRVWRKVNDELHLKEKGLLDVLGLDGRE